MKKLILAVLICSTFSSVAQIRNEIKFDVFDILALKSLDVSYELIINPESSVGISSLFNFEKESASFKYEQDFVLTPYYRQVLFSKGNIGYFGEFFGSLNTGRSKKALEGIEDNYTDFAFGLSFGGKYMSDNGFVLDFLAGIGRNMFNTDESHEVIPRVGISIGKQF